MKDLRDIGVVHILNNLTLHHGASIVVLDVSLPSTFGHVAILVEALLLEEACGIVVSISQEVLDPLFLGMIL